MDNLTKLFIKQAKKFKNPLVDFFDTNVSEYQSNIDILLKEIEQSLIDNKSILPIINSIEEKRLPYVLTFNTYTDILALLNNYKVTDAEIFTALSELRKKAQTKHTNAPQDIPIQQTEDAPVQSSTEDLLKKYKNGEVSELAFIDYILLKNGGAFPEEIINIVPLDVLFVYTKEYLLHANAPIPTSIATKLAEDKTYKRYFRDALINKEELRKEDSHREDNYADILSIYYGVDAMQTVLV